MKYLIKNATIVNEGEIFSSDILIEDQVISRIDRQIENTGNIKEINAEKLILMPGAIDDQVHFREHGKDRAKAANLGCRSTGR